MKWRRSPAAALGLAAILFGALSVEANAGFIRVLTLNESRVGTFSNSNGSISFNFAFGDGYATARNMLLDPSNFGSGGVVPDSVSTLTTVSELTPSNLALADIVILPIGSVTANEEVALLEFLNQGGGLLAFRNGAANGFGFLLGATAGTSNSTGSAQVSSSSPVATGPFGSLGNKTVGIGAAGSFASLGPDGEILLTSNSQVTGATFEIGSGKAAIFTDEEIFLSKSVAGIAAGKLSLTNNNGKLFRNAFAYVAPSSDFQFTPVPEPSSFAMLLAGALGIAGLGLRRRRQINEC